MRSFAPAAGHAYGAGIPRHRPYPPAMPFTPDALLAHLKTLGIETRTVRHEPVFTVDEAKGLRETMPGGHCKSLFLRDKRGEKHWLLVCDEDVRVDLKAMAKRLGASRLSFGSPERLWAMLGVRPGSVTPFALINDPDHRITVLLDRQMLAHSVLHYHPLDNSMTTAIAPGDLVKFIEACGHAPHIIELGAPA